jgi:hypothetical protein
MFDTTMSLCRVGMIHMKDEGWRSWVNWYNRSGWLFLVHFSFYKIKIIKLIFFLKNRNWTETGSNRPVSVRFFRTKTGSNWFGSIFLVWLGFFGLARFFFLIWLGFFPVFFVCVRFFRL